jgi:hypothetical protein
MTAARSVSWPWRQRLNPAPAELELGRPAWRALRRSGEWAREVRELVRGEAGVYAIRETSNPETVLYVGESHSPSSKAPLRMWKTILRHFQAARSFERMGEWTYSGTHDLDVALWLTPPSEAFEAEGRLIARLEPLHTTPREV